MEVSVGSGVLIGQSFTVLVSVTNKTKKSHQYSVRVRGRAMLYTGITGQVVRNHSENISLRPDQGEWVCLFVCSFVCVCVSLLNSLSSAGQVKMAVRAIDYLKLLEGGNFIHFVAMVIADNDVAAVATHNLRLKVCPSLPPTLSPSLTPSLTHSLTHLTHSLLQTPDISISLPEGGLKLYRPASLVPRLSLSAHKLYARDL